MFNADVRLTWSGDRGEGPEPPSYSRANEVVFNADRSIWSARTAVYSFLGLDRQPSAVSKGTPDPRVLYRAS